MRGTIPPLPNMPSWRGIQLEHRGDFTYYAQRKSAKSHVQ